MKLTKIETICTACTGQYILVVNEDDVDRVSYCPFCGSPSTPQEEDE